MTMHIDEDKPLSDEDRAYWETRGYAGATIIARIDAKFPDVEDLDEVEVEGDNYDELTTSDLQAELVNRGLAKSGTKTELVQRLRDNDAAAE
jgi:hypothetical protein